MCKWRELGKNEVVLDDWRKCSLNSGDSSLPRNHVIWVEGLGHWEFEKTCSLIEQFYVWQAGVGVSKTKSYRQTLPRVLTRKDCVRVYYDHDDQVPSVKRV